MSAIVNAVSSPKGGAASAAAKLKGFGLALNKSFGIAKRWTLEKVGAREPSQEPPEVSALIAAFNQDKADIEEIRGKVQHLITVSSSSQHSMQALQLRVCCHSLTLHLSAVTAVQSEKTLLDADVAFAQAVQEVHIPALSVVHSADSSTAEDASTSAAAASTSTEASVSASSSTASAASSSASASSAPPSGSAHPPFTPQTFASYLAQVHSAHSAYLSLLSTHLLDPIDAILDQDVALLATIIRQLPVLRLDHHAKHDAVLGILQREDRRGLEEAQAAEKESREVWEAQMEVVDKLAREVAVKKAELLRIVAETYVRESRQWYEEMQQIIEDAERRRRVGGAERLQHESMTVKETVEATVDAAVTQAGQLGEQILDAVVPEHK